MAAAAIVFLQDRAPCDECRVAVLRAEDVLRLRRIGDQANYKRDDRLALLGGKWELRHPQALVEALVFGLVVIVAARLFELLVDEADAIAGLQRVRIEGLEVLRL